MIHPLFLVITRLLLGFLIFFDSRQEKPSARFIGLFFLGFASDILDGIVARTYHNGTIAICVLDGVADATLYTAALFYLKKFYASIIKPYQFWLILLVVLQMVAWTICLIKFGHISAWHTYMAKIFGLVIVTTMATIVFFKKNIFVPVLLIVGAVYLCDDIAITLIMPYWRVGVMSAFQALHYRNQQHLK